MIAFIADFELDSLGKKGAACPAMHVIIQFAIDCKGGPGPIKVQGAELQSLIQLIEVDILSSQQSARCCPKSDTPIKAPPPDSRRNPIGRLEQGKLANSANQAIVEMEQHISLEQARQIMPGQPSTVSIWRWHSKGVKGVRLETICVAGRRFTTREAIDRFIAATTAAANSEPPPLRSPMKRARAIEAAEQELG